MRSLWDATRRAGYLGRMIWRVGRVPGLALVGLTVTGGVIPALTAWCTKLIIDDLTIPGRLGGLPGVVALLGVVGIVATCLPQASGYLQAELGRRLDLGTQDELFGAVDRIRGLAPLERPAFRDRLRLAEQGSGPALGVVISAVAGIVRDLLAVLSLLATLLVVGPALVLLVLLPAVPALIAQLALTSRRVELSVDISPATRRRFFFRSLLVDVQVAKEVRVFGLGGFLRDRVRAETQAVQRAQRAMDRRELRVQSALAVLEAGLHAAALGWAAYQAGHGRLTIGDLSVFLAASVALRGALAGLVGGMSSGYQLMAYFRNYVDLVTADQPGDLPLPRRPVHLTGDVGQGIELRDVWFRYADDRPWVLRGVNLTLPPGTTVALAGANGSGKSTLVKLLCRMYDPTLGTIRWDGVDLRDVPVEELRRRIGTVFQDYVVYDLTVAENIGVGKLDRLGDPYHIEAAARRAGIHQDLATLPAGYQTLLSQSFMPADSTDRTQAGVALSGGQRQRLAIARALLRDDCDLLILDEPSAALDARAERELHDRLRADRPGRITVLVSHRLGTLRSADHIVMLRDGRVAEAGPHERLLAADGEYADLFAPGSAGYQPAGG